jgi:hypothetical protein
MKLLWMNTIGMTILIDALKESSYLFTGSDGRGHYLRPKKRELCEESLAFVQGTGMDMMINTYYIAYDPHELRNTFFTRFNRRDLID